MLKIVSYEELWRSYVLDGEKSQSIWSVQENAVSEHLTTMFLTFVFFSILMPIVWYGMENVLKPKWYMERTTEKDGITRFEVCQKIVQYPHHIFQAYLAVLNMLYLCDIPFGQFYCDETCLFTYKPLVSHSIMFSIGYFIYDLALIKFVIKDNTILGKQLMFHHLLSSGVFIVCLFGGRDMPALSQTVLVCEISNFFLNMKEILGKRAEGPWVMLNNICFFITFTFLRVLFFPLHINAHFHTALYYDVLAQSPFEIFAWGIAIFLFLGIWLLQLYWFQFILRALKRIINGEKKGDKKENLLDPEMQMAAHNSEDYHAVN